jgi:hypothetical protein
MVRLDLAQEAHQRQLLLHAGARGQPERGSS